MLTTGLCKSWEKENSRLLVLLGVVKLSLKENQCDVYAFILYVFFFLKKRFLNLLSLLPFGFLFVFCHKCCVYVFLFSLNIFHVTDIKTTIYKITYARTHCKDLLRLQKLPFFPYSFDLMRAYFDISHNFKDNFIFLPQYKCCKVSVSDCSIEAYWISMRETVDEWKNPWMDAWMVDLLQMGAYIAIQCTIMWNRFFHFTNCITFVWCCYCCCHVMLLLFFCCCSSFLSSLGSVLFASDFYFSIERVFVRVWVCVCVFFARFAFLYLVLCLIAVMHFNRLTFKYSWIVHAHMITFW